MTAPLGNTFYNGTDGVAISAANSVTSGDACVAPVLNTATAKYSNLQAWAPSTIGLQLDYTLGGTSAGYVPWNFAPATATTRVAHRFYFYTGATFTTQDFFAVRSAAAALMKLSLDATGKLLILNSANTTVATATTALSANTWYRLEMAITVGTTTSNGVIELSYYAGNSTTPVQTFTTITNANLGTAAPASVRLGTASAVASTRTQYYGAFGVAELASGFIGPNTATVTGTTPVALGLTGAPAAVSTGTLSLTLGLTGAATPQLTGQVPLAVALTGVPRTIVAGSLPLSLALSATAVSVVSGSIPLRIGLTGTVPVPSKNITATGATRARWAATATYRDRVTAAAHTRWEGTARG